MCVCLCYKPRKRHLPLPKNAKFRGSETQLHSFVLWRFGSSPALCVRAAFTSSAGGTGHDQKCHHECESIFSCNCCCPYKNRMVDRLHSVMQCPVWAVACVPSVFSLSHTYSALFIHVSVAGHQPTAVSGKQEHLFGGVNICNAQHVGCNVHHSSLRLATVETCIDQQHFTG